MKKSAPVSSSSTIRYGGLVPSALAYTTLGGQSSRQMVTTTLNSKGLREHRTFVNANSFLSTTNPYLSLQQIRDYILLSYSCPNA